MEVTVYSDFWNNSLELHLKFCADVIALCELFNIPYYEIGLQGSVPYVSVRTEDGEYLGTILIFDLAYDNKGHPNKFIFGFDPSVFGVEYVEYKPFEGWIYYL